MSNNKLDKQFLSCVDCIHFVDAEQPICSAVKGIKLFRTQWDVEYPFVKFPDNHLNLARFCSKYTPIKEEKYETPKEEKKGFWK